MIGRLWLRACEYEPFWVRGVDSAVARALAVISREAATKPIGTICLAVLICMVTATGLLKMEIDDEVVESWSLSGSYTDSWRDDYRSVFGVQSESAFAVLRPGLGVSDLLDALEDVYGIEAAIRGVTTEVDGEEIALHDVCMGTGEGPTRYCVTMSPLDYYGLPFGPSLLEAVRNDTDPYATVSPINATNWARVPIYSSIVLGDATRDENLMVTNTRGLLISVMLRSEPEFRDVSQQWQLAFLDELERLAERYHPRIDISRFATFGVDEEIAEASQPRLELFLGAGALMVTFVAMTAGSKQFSPMHSKFWAAQAGVSTVPLGLMFATGIYSAAGYKFSMISIASLFMVLAIGIDDTFVLISAFEMEEANGRSHRRSAIEVVTSGVSKAAASVTLTTVTDLAAFATGIFTPIQTISDWCILTLLGVFAVFVLSMTIVPAALVLDLRRKRAGRPVWRPVSKSDMAHFICCLFTTEEPAHPTGSRRSLDSSSINTTTLPHLKVDTAPPPPPARGQGENGSLGEMEMTMVYDTDLDAEPEVVRPRRDSLQQTIQIAKMHGVADDPVATARNNSHEEGKTNRNNNNNNVGTTATQPHITFADASRENQSVVFATADGTKGRMPRMERGGSAIAKWVRNLYAPVLLSNPGRAVVIVIFLGVFATACYFVTQLEIHFLLAQHVTDSSYMRDTVAALSEVVGGMFAIVDVVVTDVDLTDTTQYTAVMDIVSTLQGSSYTLQHSQIPYWMFTFLAYAQAVSSPCVDPTAVTRGELRTCIESFLASPSGGYFANDIHFSPTNHVTTRVRVVSTPFEELHDAYQVRKKFTEGLEIYLDSPDSPVQGYVYSWFFQLGDLSGGLATALLHSVLAAFGGVVVILFLFLQPSLALVTAFMIASVQVVVISSPAMWDFQAGPGVLAIFVISVGLAVDFSVHVAKAYALANGTSKDRVAEALEEVCKPVLLGGLSTIVGTLVMQFTPSYSFRIIFRLVVTIVVVGLLHGVVLLPVIMSLVFPAKTDQEDDAFSPKKNALKMFSQNSQNTPGTVRYDTRSIPPAVGLLVQRDAEGRRNSYTGTQPCKSHRGAAVVILGEPEDHHVGLDATGTTATTDFHAGRLCSGESAEGDVKDARESSDARESGDVQQPRGLEDEERASWRSTLPEALV